MGRLERVIGLAAAILWLGATILTWTLAWLPWAGGNEILSDIAVSSGEDPTPWLIYVIGGAFLGAICGGILGLGQWLIIRQHSYSGVRWIALTMVGMAIGLGVGELLARISVYEFRVAHDWALGQQFAYPDLINMATQSAVLEYLPVGIALGLSQWSVLRTSTRHAWQWLLISLVAWPVGAAIYWQIYGAFGGPFCQSWLCLFDPPGPGYAPASLLGWLAGGLAIGVATGLTIKSLVSSPTGPDSTKRDELTVG